MADAEHFRSQERPEPEWLTTRQVSKASGAPEPTLRTWRRRDDVGPPWVRLNERTIRYPRAEFEQWLASQHRGGAVARANA